jgi:outer membrane protein OmpA-like peptidoglycan-associated protein
MVQVPYLHMRVEGHTSYSKKSADGGKATSNARANAVCNELIAHGVPENILHPVGHGCSVPKTNNPKDAANRRVEIHVMDEAEAQRHMRQAQAKAKRGKSNPLAP